MLKRSNKKLNLSSFVSPRKVAKKDNTDGGGVSSELLSSLKSLDSAQRLKACNTLASLEDRDVILALVPALVGMLEQEANRQVQHQAVKTLGVLKDSRALDILTHVGHDTTVPYYIRNSALEAIKNCPTSQPPSTSPSKSAPGASNPPEQHIPLPGFSRPVIQSNPPSRSPISTTPSLFQASPSNLPKPPISQTPPLNPPKPPSQSNLPKPSPISQTPSTPLNPPKPPSTPLPTPPPISQIPSTPLHPPKPSPTPLLKPSPISQTPSTPLNPPKPPSHSTSETQAPTFAQPNSSPLQAKTQNNTPPAQNNTSPVQNNTSPAQNNTSPNKSPSQISPPQTSGTKSRTRKRADAPKKTIDSYFKASPKKAKIEDIQSPPPVSTPTFMSNSNSNSTPTPTPTPTTQISTSSEQGASNVILAMNSYKANISTGPVSSPSQAIGGFNKVITQNLGARPAVISQNMQNSGIGSRPPVILTSASLNTTTTTTIPSNTNTLGTRLSVSAYSIRNFSSSEVNLDAITSIVEEPAKKTPPKPKKPLVPLSDEQQAIVTLALSGDSFFFTGRAGTGKSLVMREMVSQLRALHGEQSVFVTASTGIAACNIGGTTLHAFAGVGIGEEPAHELAAKASKNRASAKRWRSANVLLIDEVSMLSGDFFDKIEYVAREVREDNNPFGGLQVILCGDFFQLPPVTKGGDSSNFCFDADCWKFVIKNCIELKKVFRQRESDFVGVLDEVRMAKVSDKAAALLQKCLSNVLNSDDGIQPTRLSKQTNPHFTDPHKKTVDEENKKFLESLPGEKYTFKAEDTGVQNFVQQLEKNCAAPSVLDLKLNAQVMLIKNLDIDREQVNGARGVVTGWEIPSEEDSKKFPDFKDRDQMQQTKLGGRHL